MFEGVSIRYGDEFKRKIQLYDPVKKKYSSVMDDGTYVIENGKVTGR